MVSLASHAIHYFFEDVSNGLLTFASSGVSFFDLDRDRRCVFVSSAPCQSCQYLWKTQEELFYALAQLFRGQARMICVILAADFDSSTLWNLVDRPISVFPAHHACL